MNTQAVKNESSADQNAKALEYGLDYARRTGKTVYFFSANDPERTEHGNGEVSLKFGRRLWLWTTKRHELDHAPWRFERSSSSKADLPR